MKTEKVTFTCDNKECAQKIERDKKEIINPRFGYGTNPSLFFNYPYDEGWLYLYNMNFQRPDYPKPEETRTEIRKRIEVKDKHFCSKKCLIKFLGDIIE